MTVFILYIYYFIVSLIFILNREQIDYLQLSVGIIYLSYHRMSRNFQTMGATMFLYMFETHHSF